MTLDQIYREVKLYESTINKDEIYSWYKAKIVELNLPPDEYESAIKKLFDILEY